MMTKQKAESRRKQSEVDHRLKEEAQNKKRRDMEADLEREEILKKVEG